MLVRYPFRFLMFFTIFSLPLAFAGPGGGVIRGKVILEGQQIKPKVINMSSEPACANQYSTAPTTEDSLVGAGGALQNALVYVSAGAPDETSVRNEAISFEQKGCRFVPHVAVMQVNQRLRVVNDDATSHNIHPLPTINREWNKAQPPGTPPLAETFPREEIIPVKCNIHPWMH